MVASKSQLGMDLRTTVPYPSKMRDGMKSLAIACLALCWAALAGVPQHRPFDRSVAALEPSSHHQSLQLPKRLDVARPDGPTTVRSSRGSFAALTRSKSDGGDSAIRLTGVAQGSQPFSHARCPVGDRAVVSDNHEKRANQPRAPPSCRLA